MKFVVIGAGLSGLEAAYRLQEAGHQLPVLEAGSLPGGRCHVTRTHGFLVDLCPEIASGSYARFLNMARNADPGFYRRTAALLANLATSRNVQLAGDPFGAGCMEAAVVWGERAADRLIASTESTR